MCSWSSHRRVLDGHRNDRPLNSVNKQNKKEINLKHLDLVCLSLSLSITSLFCLLIFSLCSVLVIVCCKAVCGVRACCVTVCAVRGNYL